MISPPRRQHVQLLRRHHHHRARVRTVVRAHAVQQVDHE
jgi:hypothetical protein